MLRPDTMLATGCQTAMLASGWLLIAAGLLALPLPGPFTTPALTMGGLVLARRSTTFRHGVARLRGRFPENSRRLTERSRAWPRMARYIVLRTDPRRMAWGII